MCTALPQKVFPWIRLAPSLYHWEPRREIGEGPVVADFVFFPSHLVMRVGSESPTDIAVNFNQAGGWPDAEAATEASASFIDGVELSLRKTSSRFQGMAIWRQAHQVGIAMGSLHLPIRFRQFHSRTWLGHQDLLQEHCIRYRHAPPQDRRPMCLAVLGEAEGQDELSQGYRRHQLQHKWQGFKGSWRIFWLVSGPSQSHSARASHLWRISV